jgi:CRP-like cAMP-binding protein
MSKSAKILVSVVLCQPTGNEVNSMDTVIQLFDGYGRGLHEQAVRQYCEIREFKPGQPIVMKGEKSTHICIVLVGEATATISKTLSVPFSIGQSFGELSFIDGEPRSVRVNASGESNTTIAVLTREGVDRIRKEEPQLAAAITLNLLKTMAKHVRTTDNVLLGLDVELQRKLARAAPGLLGRLTAVLS